MLSLDETARLLCLDADLRREADVFLRESGFGAIIESAGFKPVGSFVMRTMTWRDLDFERVREEPSWSEHWELGRALAQTGWGYRFSCIDEYHNPEEPGECGLYWGIKACSSDGGPIWKLDLWTARAHEFIPDSRREAWMSALDDDSRAHVIAIKEAVCQDPRYRKTLLSVHIYEAVLERGIRGLDAFWEWCEARGSGESL